LAQGIQVQVPWFNLNLDNEGGYFFVAVGSRIGQ